MHTYIHTYIHSVPCQIYRLKPASGRLLQSEYNTPLQKSPNIGCHRCFASQPQNYNI